MGDIPSSADPERRENIVRSYLSQGGVPAARGFVDLGMKVEELLLIAVDVPGRCRDLIAYLVVRKLLRTSRP